jgi:Leu/Phe-tRNA-protein transferase
VATCDPIRADFHECEWRFGSRYHIEKNEHTWLTDELIAALDEMRRDASAGIAMCAFELWEGEDLVAASFGYVWPG